MADEEHSGPPARTEAAPSDEEMDDPRWHYRSFLGLHLQAWQQCRRAQAGDLPPDAQELWLKRYDQLVWLEAANALKILGDTAEAGLLSEVITKELVKPVSELTGFAADGLKLAARGKFPPVHERVRKDIETKIKDRTGSYVRPLKKRGPKGYTQGQLNELSEADAYAILAWDGIISDRRAVKSIREDFGISEGSFRQLRAKVRSHQKIEEWKNQALSYPEGPDRNGWARKRLQEAGRRFKHAYR